MTLIVLLHGYGSNGDDMYALFRELESDGIVTCLAMEAPAACDLFKDKKQWFKLSYLPGYLNENIKKQADSIHSRLVSLKHGLPANDKIIVVGHSQGSMIAAYIGLHYHLPDVEYVCVSALLPFYEDQGSFHFSSNITFLHGEDDKMIAINALSKQVRSLMELGNNISFIPVEAAGHALDGCLHDKVLQVLKQKMSNDYVGI